MKKLLRKLKDFIRKLQGKPPKAADRPAPPMPEVTVPEHPPVVPQPAPAPGSIGKFTPGVVVRQGVRFAPAVPVAEDWIPSGEAAAFYGVYLGPNGPAAPEDRIANPPGARSPKGYPMWDGKIMFNGYPFDNEAQIAKYVAAVKDRDDALKRWEEEFGRVRYVGSSGLEAGSLSQPERAFLSMKSASYFGDLWRVVLSGPNVDIARCINDGFYIGGPTEPVREALVRAVEAAIVAQAAGRPPVYRTE